MLFYSDSPLVLSLESPAPVLTPASPPRSPILYYAAVTLIVAIGIFHAARFATVNDDAFISFRYAQQLANGNGLVYNPGERVEGFTNFLWTVLLAAGIRLGLDPVSLAIALGVVFTAGTLLLVCDFSRRFTGLTTGGVPAAIPIAALALVFHREFNVYSTSGLETPMQTFLVFLLFHLLTLREDLRAYTMGGLVLAAAVMTRPDGAVIALAAGLFIIVERKDAGARLARLAIAFLGITVPYWLIRWQYYGHFFPNAFYAKSVDLPYYRQGLVYTWLYVSSYYPLLLLPILPLVNLVRRLPEQRRLNGIERRAIVLGTAMAGLFTLFVIRIGGDFMFARFFIPITPVAYVLLEVLLRRVPYAWPRRVIALVIVAGTFFRYEYFSGTNQVGYIADEWQRYPISSLTETRNNGAILKRAFEGLPVRVAFWGGQARLMYYAEPHTAIEASAGLTDTSIAHQELETRGRPGHEKQARMEYLVSRGVNFYFRPFPPPRPGSPTLNLVVFDSLVARIVVYDNAIMDSMRSRPGVRFVPMPEYLDSYISRLEMNDPEEVRADYAWLREYYFRHNADSVRAGSFERYLDTAGTAAPPSK